MKKISVYTGFLALGILIGCGLFFMSYWMTGTITVSLGIGVLVFSGVMLAGLSKLFTKRSDEL